MSARPRRAPAPRAAALAAAIAIAAAAPPARAQASREQQALAEALFREAKELMAKKQYPEACGKLEESQRLDPGGGTLLALALCHEKEGKTATAWSEYQEAAATARAGKRRDREKIANARIAAIEPKLSRLTVKVASEEARPGYEVKLDGVVLGEGAWGTALPVDPGEREITASAPGYEDFTTRVAVGGDGDRKTIEIPPLVRFTEPDRTPLPVPDAPAEDASSWPASRTVGLVLAGAGAVGVGVGAYFGLQAFAKNDESKAGCSNGVCDAAGWESYQDGKTAATVSTIVLPAGAVALGIGAVLFFSSLGGEDDAAPAEGTMRSFRVAAGPTPGGAFVAVGGAF